MKYDQLCETCISDVGAMGRASYCPDCELLNKVVEVPGIVWAKVGGAAFWTRPFRATYLIGLVVIAGAWVGWPAALLVILASIDITPKD